MKKKYSFGEEQYDYYNGVKIPVKKLPKYETTKSKVIALLEKEEYKDILNESDFWILKNYNKDKSVCYYSGLIITHDALIKVNDMLNERDKFNQQFCSDPIPFVWNGKDGLRMEYRDGRDGMYEVGEISVANCKNDYPFAMLFKRIFDRVVKRKAKLSMVYSESEAEEFREPQEKEEPKATDEQVAKIINLKDVIMDELMARNINSNADVKNLSVVEASKLCEMIEERMNGES